MKLKRHLNPWIIFVGLYFLAFSVYIVYGLQPVGAAEYNISAKIAIQSIGLESDVTELKLVNHELETPDMIVGSYSRAKNKTLLIGHATTVFKNLDKLKLRDAIEYAGNTYQIKAMDLIPKSGIDMNELLKTSDVDTLVLMTCAGKIFEGGDATHRLMITAVRD